MYRRRDDHEPEEDEEEYAEEEDYGGSSRKRRSEFINNDAEEDDEKEEDVGGGGRRGGGGGGGHHAKRRSGSEFFDLEVAVDSDEEEEEENEDGQNIQPTCESGDGDMASLSTSVAKKGLFMKGDRVVFAKGDLKNLKGWVGKVEEETVYIKPMAEDLHETLTVSDKEICKYFVPGNHVKVVSGATKGATGLVIKVDGHCVIIVSDTTKEVIRVFADNVVESSEVTSGVTRIGDYELHDLVLLDNRSFGVIVRVEREAFQVFKGVPERPEVMLVRLREIKCKLERKAYAQDWRKNIISVKDVVRIIEGPCNGKQGPVEHIIGGILFIYDRHHLGHAGFICAKSGSCLVVDGSRPNGDKTGGSQVPRFSNLRTTTCVPESPRRLSRGAPPLAGGRNRGGRGHDALVGATVKVRQGPYKGYRGHVVDVKGPYVRVELESQMKVVSVDRNHISDNVVVSTPFRESPVHPLRTPLHPYKAPGREPGGGDTEGAWFLPNILVNVCRSGEDIVLGVIREVLPDGSCRIALGTSGNSDTITALPNEMEIIVPRKNDKIKIMGGAQRGETGKLIGVDGSDGIVEVDDTLDVKLLDMVILAKLAQS